MGHAKLQQIWLFLFFCVSVYVYGCPQGPEEGFESSRARVPNVSTQNKTLIFWKKEKERKFLPDNFKYSKGKKSYILQHTCVFPCCPQTIFVGMILAAGWTVEPTPLGWVTIILVMGLVAVMMAGFAPAGTVCRVFSPQIEANHYSGDLYAFKLLKQTNNCHFTEKGQKDFARMGKGLQIMQQSTQK